MTTTTGPAELRRLVERNRILTPITPEEILAQAAAWEADRAALERARALVARWKAEANPSEPALSASVVFLAHSMADELAAALGS